MIIQPLDDLLVRPIVDMALAEDLGRAGDITGQACIDPDARLSVVWASRQDGRVSGLSCARLALAALDPSATFEVVTSDGADAAPGAILARPRATPAPCWPPSARG
jgi:nicotinate-nucleotide pyrophosphorylase (carboxylating)